MFFIPKVSLMCLSSEKSNRRAPVQIHPKGNLTINLSMTGHMLVTHFATCGLCAVFQVVDRVKAEQLF